jgi:hypothetical protein
MDSSPKVVCGNSHGLGSGRLIILKILLELKKTTLLQQQMLSKAPSRSRILGAFVLPVLFG